MTENTNEREETPPAGNPNMDGAKLEGRVAQILNERELIINIGMSDGVEVGMRFEVLAESPLQITDPEDETRVIGTYDRPKVNVEAFDVEDHMSVCRTYETITTPGNMWWQVQQSPMITGLGIEAIPPTTRHVNLRASEDQYPAPLSQSESYVKRGDRVRELVST